MKLNIDIAEKIGAVERKIETREYNDQPARVAFASRTYNTSIDDLWDALTSPERIPRWFLPITGDLKLGGRYQLEGNAGGEITACEPPKSFSVTWEFGGGISWVNVTLSEKSSDATHLQLEHIAHVPDEFWNEYGPGAVGVGWDQALLGLDLYVSSGTSLDPSEAVAWVGSDEGKEFVRLSSDAWCQASIASGTDPSAARSAADRTTAFYTGAGNGTSEQHEE